MRPDVNTTIGESSGSLQLPRPDLDPPSDHPRYEILDEVGRGGMGVVMRARDLELDRDVAMKLLLDDGPTMQRRFDLEAHVTARLQHPAIVAVYDVGRLRNGTPFYTMKLVVGESLHRRIDRCRSLAERMALLPALVAVTEAVAYAHSQGVIHRDLKPANVLVGDFGETVVLDWGIAKQDRLAAHHDEGETRVREPGLTGVGTVVGTAAYMPPEQADGRAVDTRADVYAIGAILYHALSGGAPYRGASNVLVAVSLDGPAPLEANIPADLRALVAKAMSRDPAARYPSATQLLVDLRRFVDGQFVLAHHYTWRERMLRFLRRNRAAAVVATALGAALLVVTSVAFDRVLSERDTARREREVALEAREAATSARIGAEKLIGFMLEDLSERLDRVGQIRLLGAVGDRIDAYFSAVPPDDDDAMASSRHVDALLVRGHADVASHGPAARASLTATVAAARALGDARRLAEALHLLSIAAREEGEADESLGLLREALDHADAAHDPAIAVAIRTDLARVHGRVGPKDAADRESLASLLLAEAIVARAPGTITLEVLLADATVVRARALASVGPPDRSIALLLALEQRLDALRRADPGDTRLMAVEVDAKALRARIESRRDNLAEARTVGLSALDAAQRLVDRDPENLSWQRKLFDAIEIEAAHAGRAAEYERSLSSYSRMRTIATLLANATPSDMDARVRVLRVDSNIAEVHRATGRTEEAVSLYSSIESELDGLLHTAKIESVIQHLLLESLLDHADTLFSARRDAESMPIARRALALAEELTTTHPDSIDGRMKLVRSLLRIADLAAADERQELAERAFEIMKAMDAAGTLRNQSDQGLYSHARLLMERGQR